MQSQFPRKQLDEFIFCKVQEYLSHFERSNLTHFPAYTCNYKIYQEFFQRKIFHVVLLSIFFNSHSMDHKIPTIDIFLRNLRSIGFVWSYCSMKKRWNFFHTLTNIEKTFLTSFLCLICFYMWKNQGCFHNKTDASFSFRTKWILIIIKQWPIGHWPPLFILVECHFKKDKLE